MKHFPGHCPKCETDHLDYGFSKTYDESIGFPFTCLECGFIGEEVANVIFSHFEDEDNNEVSETEG